MLEPSHLPTAGRPLSGRLLGGGLAEMNDGRLVSTPAGVGLGELLSD
jgi:hypothetical protein